MSMYTSKENRQSRIWPRIVSGNFPFNKMRAGGLQLFFIDNVIGSMDAAMQQLRKARTHTYIY